MILKLTMHVPHSALTSFQSPCMQASLSRKAACLFGLHESNTVCSESEHTNSSEGCAMLALLAGWLADLLAGSGWSVFQANRWPHPRAL
jgi:hypothetical protein